MPLLSTQPDHIVGRQETDRCPSRAADTSACYVLAVASWRKARDGPRCFVQYTVPRPRVSKVVPLRKSANAGTAIRPATVNRINNFNNIIAINGVACRTNPVVNRPEFEPNQPVSQQAISGQSEIRVNQITNGFGRSNRRSKLTSPQHSPSVSGD